MLEVAVAPPKRIHPGRLEEELGHPLSVDVRPADGLAVAARVQDRYADGQGNPIVPNATEAAVQAAVAAHDANRETAAPAAERQRLARLDSIRAKRRQGQALTADGQQTVLDDHLGLR